MIKKHLAAACASLALLSGCQTLVAPQYGMTEQEWLKTTKVMDIAYMEGTLKAFRSDGRFYYFKNERLVRIDDYLVPAQRIEADLKAQQK